MDINPVLIITSLLDKVKAEFPEFSSDREASDLERSIAELLFDKFSEVTTQYEIIEEEQNEFENEIGEELSPLSTSQSELLSSESQNFLKKPLPKKRRLDLKEKIRILKVIEENPDWSFRTCKQRFSAFKHPSYKYKWQKHIEDGGSKRDIQEEIQKYTLKNFSEARAKFKPVHDADLQKWAMQRALDFPSIRNSFVASKCFVRNFKRKNRITSRRITKLVKKREVVCEEELLNRSESFRKELQNLQKCYNLQEIWNTDQIGFQYEYISKRTLSNKGEKFTFGSVFSPTNRMTHSYTVQYIINAAGEIVGNAFVCLQEQKGQFGPIVSSSMLQTPNLSVTCSVSGKLTTGHVKYFVDNVIKPVVTSRVLYVLDGWTGQVNTKIYSEATALENVDFSLKVIPSNCTPYVQPLDVYFNLQLKYFVKKLYDYGNILNIQMTCRNDILKIQSLAHFILSSPKFKNMISYCWIKAELIDKEKDKFESVKEVCFNFKCSGCEFVGCTENCFIRCSWCEKLVCFNHFYINYHLIDCMEGPYSTK